MTVGHLTLPLVGIARRTYERGQHPPYGWHGAALQAFEEGALMGMDAVVSRHGTVVVGDTRIAFHVDAPKAHGTLACGAALLAHPSRLAVEAAIDALQRPHPFFPSYDLLKAWGPHAPDTDDSDPTARVFSHPDGWVVGTDEPGDLMGDAFAILSDSMQMDPSLPDADLSTLSADDFPTGTFATVVVALDVDASHHARLDAVARGHRVFEAWKVRCKDWLHPVHLGIPAPIPVALEGRIGHTWQRD